MFNAGFKNCNTGYVNFKKKELPKTNQPLAGKIVPNLPPKPAENLPAIIYPPPLAGIIAPPKVPKAPKLPGGQPPLAGIIAPPAPKKPGNI